MQRYEDRGLQPPLPDPGLAKHLLGYLMEVGPVGQGAMGPVPINHGDIAAWQSNTGTELTAWEARTLRALSIDWCNTLHAATAEDFPPPWVDVEQAERDRVADQVRAIFGGRARQQRKAN